MRTWVVLAALAATALGGCAAAGSGSNVTVSGRALTIYAAASASGGQPAGDVLEAERLAFNQRSSEVTAFQLRLRTLSATNSSQNARTAISDTSAIAYLGEIAPGTSINSVGITNAEQLLQVSPTDTAQGLTDAHTPGLSGEPDKYLESVKTYGRTFARVVPNTGAEAHADAAELQTLGIHSLYVASDGSDYAIALEASLRAAASGVTVTTGPLDAGRVSGAGAVYAATDSISAARSFFAAVAAAHPGVTLFGPSALADPAVVSGLPSTARLFVSSPGFMPRSAPAAAAGFSSQFRSTYGHAPAPQAIFGYEAMAAVLDVLHQSGTSASSRGLVVHAFLTIHTRAASVLGPYSINADGDTSIAPFVILRLRSGGLVPVAQQQG